MFSSLVVLNGNRPGTSVALDPNIAMVTIGRHSSNDLQLDDDRASRTHARVVYRGERWHVEDCGSLNGTFVNSQLIGQSMLESGDLIRIADRLILYVDADERQVPTDRPTSLFRATTTYGPHEADATGRLVEQSVSESMSRMVRDSSVLSRLANLLQQHPDTETLIRAAIDALVEGIRADAVSFWIVAPDGRLRSAARSAEWASDHILASLAVEKKKAIFVAQATGTADAESRYAVGQALAVPLPGRRSILGAIQCHRANLADPFLRADLDFAVVVAHQAGLTLENLEHCVRLEAANDELRRRLAARTRLVGSSSAMQRVLDQVARVAPTNSTVLILGESGTGKELIARSLHDLSRNSGGPYVAVNCAAFSDSLLESELFGHEMGAFTGADRRYVGQFERANRGTIFLDEVGEMSLACQAKLLRVLEGHPFQRLGGQDSIHVDVRVISATHRNLPDLIAHKRFREDLYYRLRVIDIYVPPLRERGDDVVELAAQFLESYRLQLGRGPRRFSAEALAAIRAGSWPGNVRELKNAVERAIVLGQGEEVVTADLGLQVAPNACPATAEMLSLKEAERQHILRVLERCGGNKTQACRILGIGRATLYAKLNDGEPPTAE